MICPDQDHPAMPFGECFFESLPHALPETLSLLAKYVLSDPLGVSVPMSGWYTSPRRRPVKRQIQAKRYPEPLVLVQRILQKSSVETGGIFRRQRRRQAGFDPAGNRRFCKHNEGGAHGVSGMRIIRRRTRSNASTARSTSSSVVFLPTEKRRKAAAVARSSPMAIST